MTFIQIPDYARTAPKPFGYDPRTSIPLQYRFDGMKGLFECSDMVVDSLEIQPFAVRHVEEKRWARLAQTWFDIAFVDPSGAVGVLSLNKRSANNWSRFAYSINQAGIVLHSLEVTLIPETVEVTVIDGNTEESYDEIYFAVRFPKLDQVRFVDQERMEKLSQLREVFVFNILGEVEP